MQVLPVRTLAMLGSDVTRDVPRACRRIVTALNRALEWLLACISSSLNTLLRCPSVQSPSLAEHQSCSM